MTLTSRSPADTARRPLAIVAGLALALALLPLAGTAQAQDPPPNVPCPEGTPVADFIDRDAARSAHLLSIDCVAFHAISVGSSDPDGNPIYSPAGVVNRAQMATFIANTLDAAGFELPDGDEPHEFTDISGTIHRERINALARAGIVSGRTADLYRPLLPVTRAQMATFIVQAAEWAFDEELEADDGPWFEDTIGSTHEDNIDAGFEFGLFDGRVAPTDDTLGVFDPTSGTRRDQMATFLSRLLDFLWIEQGIFGAVIDAEAEEPIEGANVTITDEDDDVVVELTTGASGLFVAELDAGDYTVTADAEGYEAATEDATVTEGQITDVLLALTAEVEPDPQGIAGTVTEEDETNGAPIEGATVTAFQNDTAIDSDTTGADGTYELDLEVGTYDVTATADGYDDDTATGVEVTADTVTPLDFELTPEVVEPDPQGIAGTVTVDDDDNGGPIEGATVTAFDNGTAIDSDTTGADGTYELDLEVGTYDLTATADGYEDGSAPGVAVTADTVTTIDFELSPVPEPSAELTPDRAIAPTSDEANPSNATPTRGDINFVLTAVDEDGNEVANTVNEFTVTNTGGADVVACVRCEAPEEETIAPGESHTFDAEHVGTRERVRVDAAAPTSVTVTGETTVDGEDVSDDATAEWVDVDEEPTGTGADVTYQGNVTAFDTEAQWYVIETAAEGTVYVEYTGGADDTYTINEATVELEAFELALLLGLEIEYTNDENDNQVHDLSVPT